jgi:hypothetical protein
MVTPEILRDLAEFLGLLRRQWVKLKLSMTPKFHCLLLRHAVLQLETSGGGLGDLGEDVLSKVIRSA